MMTPKMKEDFCTQILGAVSYTHLKACFDSFDHHITIQLLRKRIKDEAFISLMWKFLRAGYMEQWTYCLLYTSRCV